MDIQHTIIGIVGSYRKNGTIDKAVSEILAAAAADGAKISKIYLQDHSINFCTNCRTCLQQPGSERGQCVLQDDMAAILDTLEQADAFVIGAPVNCGNINALTQTFMERCVCYGYWPWGTAAPQWRNSAVTKKAVLVASSAAPGCLSRWLTSAAKSLRYLARVLSAKPIGTLWLGLADKYADGLPPAAKKRARKLGHQLAG